VPRAGHTVVEVAVIVMANRPARRVEMLRRFMLSLGRAFKKVRSIRQEKILDDLVG